MERTIPCERGTGRRVPGGREAVDVKGPAAQRSCFSCKARSVWKGESEAKNVSDRKNRVVLEVEGGG